MYNQWNDWAHVMFSTRGHWLPGDPRGFRDHDHRIHSSGHYKRPPPRAEHAGLRQYSKAILKRTVVLTPPQQRVIVDALVFKLTELHCPLRILCVDAVHAHLLVRVGTSDAERIAGKAKQYASHQLGDDLPGRIWGQRNHIVRIRSEGHYRSIVTYIERHASRSAVVWIHPMHANSQGGPRIPEPRGQGANSTPSV
jgi:hypothetical protein